MLREMIAKFNDSERVAFNEAVELMENASFIYDEGACDLFEDSSLDTILEEFEERNDLRAYLSSGATKTCLVLSNYVLKKSFDGYVEYGDCEIYDYSELDDIIYMSEIEKRVYEKAKEWGVEKYFAEVINVGKNVYMQERVHTCLPLRRGEDSTKNVPSHFVAMALDCGDSMEELKRLDAFLEEFDINDLHNGNLGMLNGRPVIFDYSGYESNTGSAVHVYG